ncbi:ribosome-associated translation inhibitor RaiA [Candidatus Sumerlaeota bacterium]|nr:ribosome-associated translation inhibitor RaiA [Candidatus Sumerlaeota bacterium]
MPLKIVGRKRDIAGQDRRYIEQKVDRLRRLADRISLMDVMIDEVRHNTLVSIEVKAPRLHKKVSEQGETVRSAFDLALDKMETTMRRGKERMQRNKKQMRKHRLLSQTPVDAANALATDVEEQPAHTIINMERMSFKPMSVEEAAEQIEVGDRPLMVFVNDASERLNVLYRRKDGHYGLIEPL